MASLAVLFLPVLFLILRAEARPPPPLHGVRHLAFEEGYTQIFGSSNLALHPGGKRVRLALDQSTGQSVSAIPVSVFPSSSLLLLRTITGSSSSCTAATGSGFASQGLFLHGFFSAAIKLPAAYAAGVVVAFYLSNGDVYEKTHDELDFEFLGNVRGRDWRVQTNVYGNGSTHAGREERYDLPFDPTEDFHHYSILWTHQRIIFYVDETPIREVPRTASMGAAFPSKPMSLYATIWDGSSWATLGGRYGVDYKYAPFVAEFADLVLHACAVDRSASASASTCDAAAASAEQRSAMAAFRRGHMSYSYCHDRRRYAAPLNECAAAERVPAIARLFGPDGMRLPRRRHRGTGHRAQDDVM
ncbi:hypothetical protein PR202_ga15926 [Eleusine coracana subsp. coracana]|uniref:Xyloglucan endotransglucosylase/hydrolase n=1 Tax=Eleusine coracana subsp. coracana TaxID=191504 RepID=A0AAV5CLJ0_ELECO|nr:hypothetical protein PR202_ga15926 [Eleusine coracana subsp. coracana]